MYTKSRGEKCMISEISKRTAGFLSKNMIIETEYEEVYAYGIEILLSTILNFIVALTIALISHKFVACLLNLTAFVTIRIYAGGYHADTHWGCMTTLVGVLLIFIFVIKVISLKLMMILSPILLIISAVVIFKYAPVEHPNKPLSEKKKLKLRKKTLISLSIWILFCIFFYFIKAEFTFYAVSGIFSLAVALIAEIIKLHNSL